MKFNLIFLLLFSSCSNYTNYDRTQFSYTGKGFAYIEKTPISNSNNNNLFISHNKLEIGTKLRITNPDNKKFLELIIKKKIKYDNFYKILISENIAKDLNLDFNFPYVEINEIKKNKSFVAKKAITENIEKSIANSAPIGKINISNLSKDKKNKEYKLKSFSILVAEFYNLESAEILKKRLTLILSSSNYQLIYINKKSNKSYELLMGPYNTINKLKNDYIVLNDSNFEDLDIKFND